MNIPYPDMMIFVDTPGQRWTKTGNGATDTGQGTLAHGVFLSDIQYGLIGV